MLLRTLYWKLARYTRKKWVKNNTTCNNYASNTYLLKTEWFLRQNTFLQLDTNAIRNLHYTFITLNYSQNKTKSHLVIILLPPIIFILNCYCWLNPLIFIITFIWYLTTFNFILYLQINRAVIIIFNLFLCFQPLRTINTKIAFGTIVVVVNTYRYQHHIYLLHYLKITMLFVYKQKVIN